MKKLKLQLILLITTFYASAAFPDESSSGGLGGHSTDPGADRGPRFTCSSIIVSQETMEAMVRNQSEDDYIDIAAIGLVKTLSVFQTQSNQQGVVVQDGNGDLHILLQEKSTQLFRIEGL